MCFARLGLQALLHLTSCCLLKDRVLVSGPRTVDLKGNIPSETAAFAPTMLATAFTNMECYIGVCPGERKPISAFSLTQLPVHLPRHVLAKFCFNRQIAAWFIIINLESLCSESSCTVHEYMPWKFYAACCKLRYKSHTGHSTEADGKYADMALCSENGNKLLEIRTKL